MIDPSLASDPPLWQVLLSIVLLATSVVGLMWVCARIFRFGVPVWPLVLARLKLVPPGILRKNPLRPHMSAMDPRTG